MLRSLLAASCAAALSLPAQDAPNYESSVTRGLAVSADGLRLFALNTPDNRLAVYSLADPEQPVLLQEIPVGLEPVSVQERNADEVWVVCSLADAVQVVSLSAGCVTATIQLADEPADLCFAEGLAFVTETTDRQVRVLDADTHATLATIPLIGDEPMAVRASADGSLVYVAIQRSGNGSSIVPVDLAPPQPPPTNPALPAPPEVGLIAHVDDPTWGAATGVVLPDRDVYVIDRASLQVVDSHATVGTILFDLAVSPATGDVWVAHTDARNLVRFEPELRGHSVDHGVTRIDAGGSRDAYDLNPGVDYGLLPNPGAQAIALAQPTGLAFSPDGSRLFVAAFGSDRIAAVDPTSGAILDRMESGSIGARDMRGPRNLAHHPYAPVLYVLNRLRNSVAVFDVSGANGSQLREIDAIHDPMLAEHKEGRGFLYDARLSGNGTQSCAVCHVDAKVDGQAWDLGDRGGAMETTPGPLGIPIEQHPMKGPMTTQTLRGLLGGAPLHWRGDKGSFQDFNGAFDSLLGGSELSTADMDAYAAFIDTVVFPSNPNQNLDRSLPTGTDSPAEGLELFETTPFRSGLRCVDCHSFPTGSNETIIPGVVLQESQGFNVPQLRNAYKREGRVPVNGESSAGFGLLHDGSIDSVFELLSLEVFGPLATNGPDKTKLQEFVLAFDTGTAPTVGHTVSADSGNHDSAAVLDTIALLQGRAAAGDCDLVARGVVAGEARGYRYDSGSSTWTSDRALEAPLSDNDLHLLLADGARLSFFGVAPGAGTRVGIDRDRDGARDGDELPQAYAVETADCGLRLQVNSTPSIGNGQFAFVVDGAAAGEVGVVAYGGAADNQEFLGIDILVDLGTARTRPFATDARGTGLFAIPIPDEDTLLGVDVFAQAVLLSDCGPFGLAASQGLQFQIGQ